MIVVSVCEVNTQECKQHEVTDVSQVSTLVVPEGSVYQFSFFIYDGLDLVSSHEDAIKIGGKHIESWYCTSAVFVNDLNHWLVDSCSILAH